MDVNGKFVVFQNSAVFLAVFSRFNQTPTNALQCLTRTKAKEGEGGAQGAQRAWCKHPISEKEKFEKRKTKNLELQSCVCAGVYVCVCVRMRVRKTEKAGFRILLVFVLRYVMSPDSI